MVRDVAKSGNVGNNRDDTTGHRFKDAKASDLAAAALDHEVRAVEESLDRVVRNATAQLYAVSEVGIRGDQLLDLGQHSRAYVDHVKPCSRPRATNEGKPFEGGQGILVGKKTGVPCEDW